MRPLLKPAPPLLLFGLLFLAGYDAEPAPTRVAYETAAQSPAADDTVVVFVVAGNGNMRNMGRPDTLEQPALLDFGTRPAYEWFRVKNNNVVEEVPLYDPVPSWDARNANPALDGTKGSFWHPFVIVYHDSTDYSGTGGRTIFMSSAAEGGPTDEWQPPSGPKYTLLTDHVDDAVTKADTSFVADSLFGGIIWTLSPGLAGVSGNPYPYDEYRAELDTLLSSIGQDVIDTYGGRFYLLSTVIASDLEYPDYEPTDRQTAPEIFFGADLEADVCAEYPFCTMVQVADSIKRAHHTCSNASGGTEYCGGWYALDPDDGWSVENVHWGQGALNFIGDTLGTLAAAHAPYGSESPHTWELGVEVPNPIEWCTSGDTCSMLVPTVRARVYDDTGTIVDSFDVTPSIDHPDWRADFDGTDPEADWGPTWASLSTEFLTVELARSGGGSADETLARYVYSPGVIANTGTGFFRPNTDGEAAPVHLEVYVHDTGTALEGRVRARASGDNEPYFEDAFASGGPTGGIEDAYVLAYDFGTYEATCLADALASTAGCLSTPPDFFLARLPLTVDRPDDDERRFVFADEADAAVHPGWDVTWAVDSLVLAFPADRRLLVEADLSVDGAVFTEAESGERWGGLAVYSPGSLDLDAVTVEKAEVGIEVSSDGGTAGNVFTDVLLDQNGVGILTGYDCGQGGCQGLPSRSAFTMTESCVIDSRYLLNVTEGHGIWARHTDATVSSSDVAANDAYGLLLDDADLSAYRLRVEGNGAGSSSDDGARVLDGGDLTLSDLALAYEENLVEGNAGTEVLVETDGYATIGLEYGGRNHVAVGADTSGVLVDNAPGNDTLRAAFTYWGTGGPPPAWKILGPVDTSYPLPSSPSAEAGHPADCVGAGAASAGGGSFQGGSPYGSGTGASGRSGFQSGRSAGQSARRSAGRSVAPRSSVQGALTSRAPAPRVGGSAPRTLSPEGAAWLSSRLTALRQALSEDDDDAPLVRSLYRLQRLDRGDDLGEHAATMALLSGLHGRLTGGAPLTDGARAASEAALVGSVHDALRHGRYDDARTLLAPFGAPFGMGELPDIDGDRARWTLGLALAALDEGAGETAEAVSRIEAVLAELGPEEAPLAGDLQATVRLLTRRLEGEGVGGGFAPLAQTRPGVLPVAYALGRPYPNPFGGPSGSGQTAVPFALPEGARVEVSVFDLLGRRVVVLAEGAFPAGRHVAVLESRGLASGVYLIRAVMEAEGRSVGGSTAGSGTAPATHAFTRRVTLIQR